MKENPYTLNETVKSPATTEIVVPEMQSDTGLNDEGGFFVSKVDSLVDWARKNSLWPLPLGLSDIDITIVDDPEDIVIVTAPVTDSDQCTPVNGSVELQNITLDAATTNTEAGFEALETAGYVWDVLQSDASTLEKTFDVAATAAIFPGATALAPGTYYIRATNPPGWSRVSKRPLLT